MGLGSVFLKAHKINKRNLTMTNIYKSQKDGYRKEYTGADGSTYTTRLATADDKSEVRNSFPFGVIDDDCSCCYLNISHSRDYHNTYGKK